MPKPSTPSALIFSLSTALCCFTAIQDTARAQSKPAASRPTPAASPSDTSKPLSQKIRWPDDIDRKICIVGGKAYTVRDLVAHLETYHWPGLAKHLDTRAGKAYFQNPIVARWVRQYADILALRHEAETRGIDEATSRASLEAALKRGFRQWLDLYAKKLAKAGRGEEELTQAGINSRLAHFQRDFGLETELGGWLSLLVTLPTAEDDDRLRDYYNDHVQYFGGRLNASVIFLRNRDKFSGELFRGEARKAFRARLRDVQARLTEDGKNFEEVARLLSEDPVTAREGGLLRNISRFEGGLPKVLCRELWSLRDSEWTGPFESDYGVHFAKRLAYEHRDYYVYTDALEPLVIETMTKELTEDTLFSARKEQGVRVLY